ncbi:MAG: sulfite exporter TauE/SafE family protein [Clostridiales bacterium]|nr:sulfite exporter TauE/SafE family protein [Clostridiales bacterium]
MKVFWYILIGLCGGVLGGMGMGGGTLLIPMLTLFMKVGQHAAQGINLIAFIPMSVAAIVIHTRNKLIEKKIILPILASAVLTSAAGAFLSLKTGVGELRLYFGIFLIAVGGAYLTAAIVKKVKSKKQKGTATPDERHI